MGNSFRRPPPPPERHRFKDDSLNGVVSQIMNKEIERGSCKRKSSSTNIESLPDELMFEILLHLPADDIYGGAAFVCKKWRDLTRDRNFINEHIHRSTPGLVVQFQRQTENAVFLAMRRGRFEISKFSNYNFKHLLRASCNGLLIECDTANGCASFVVNPSTNRRLRIPPGYYSSIAYASASMSYKVVSGSTQYDKPEELGCVIWTVGVDKSWRTVCTEHLSLATRRILNTTPLTTEGFVHWSSPESGHILTLNIETEVITEIPVPKGYERGWKFYLSTGTSLTFLTAMGWFSFEVWELRQETGEWTKLHDIELDCQVLGFVYLNRLIDFSLVPLAPPNCSTATVNPVGWLNCKEALVLHAFPTRLCFVHIVRTREIDFFELGHDFDSYNFIAHRNSLVRLGRC
ncbi:hypothetical protein ABFS82_01G058700 [Erythranthe guttata]